MLDSKVMFFMTGMMLYIFTWILDISFFITNISNGNYMTAFIHVLCAVYLVVIYIFKFKSLWKEFKDQISTDLF